MKKINKIVALTLLTSIIGTQLATTGVALAQNASTSNGNQNQYYNVNTLPKINIPSDVEGDMTPVDTSVYSSGQTLRGQVSSIPVGTSFNAVVNAMANSHSSQVGDIVTANITSPVVIDGVVVIPEGSQAIGQITYVDPAGRAGKDGSIDLRFTSVKLPNGQRVPLTGKIQTVDKTGSLKGGSIKKQIVTGVGTAAVATAGGTLTGLTIGALAGVPAKMTVFGTAAGGFLGLGYVLARKGKEANLPAGTLINITLDQPASISK